MEMFLRPDLPLQPVARGWSCRARLRRRRSRSRCPRRGSSEPPENPPFAYQVLSASAQRFLLPAQTHPGGLGLAPCAPVTRHPRGIYISLKEINSNAIRT